MKFQQVVHRIDPHSTLLRTWELQGGVSAQVTALEIQQPDGQIVKMVVRQHGAADVRQNPHVAADEYRLLQILHAAGLATPVPYLLDQSSEIMPGPYIVVSYIEGESEFAPAQLPDFIHQLAAQLSKIHLVGGCNLDLSFLPMQEKVSANLLKQRPANLDESIDEGHIRDVLESVWPLPARNKPVLLHGDYWPGNILWKGGQLAGVIDWEDAKVGDPLADLGNTRLEILWAYGVDAMSLFTASYQSMTTLEFSHLPFWDMCAALRPASKIAEWARNDEIEKRMRERHHFFITQAFQMLSA
ncbi:MAG TPA: aminoglycoside phosphotransferase family protein [Anaerolineae bacterium]